MPKILFRGIRTRILRMRFGNFLITHYTSPCWLSLDPGVMGGPCGWFWGCLHVQIPKVRKIPSGWDSCIKTGTQRRRPMPTLHWVKDGFCLFSLWLTIHAHVHREHSPCPSTWDSRRHLWLSPSTIPSHLDTIWHLHMQKSFLPACSMIAVRSLVRLNPSVQFAANCRLSPSSQICLPNNRCLSLSFHLFITNSGQYVPEVLPGAGELAMDSALKEYTAQWGRSRTRQRSRPEVWCVTEAFDGELHLEGFPEQVIFELRLKDGSLVASWRGKNIPDRGASMYQGPEMRSLD